MGKYETEFKLKVVEAFLAGEGARSCWQEVENRGPFVHENCHRSSHKV